MSLENLDRVYAQATAHDRLLGLTAYPKYHAIVGAVAAKHGFTVRTGAAVFAALSPNNDYHGNLRDTERLLAAAAAGGTIESFKVSTYGPNKQKAWQIVQGSDPLQVIVAPKTRNFFLSVADPSDPLPVTIDGHMRNIWFQERKPLQTRNPNVRAVRVDKALYHEIASGVRALALREGMLGNQMQSVLWLTWRRIHGIKSPSQMELWDKDWHAANLGFVCAR